MFTGLIERVGVLGGLNRTAEGGRIEVQCDAWPESLALGESVAVQGACLTVVEACRDGFVCDVLGETLDKTNLGRMAPGCLLNLERALRADGRFGGHMVTGHVDGTAEVADVRSTGRDWELSIRCGDALRQGVVPKGSIACDGVSLTVAQVRPEGFSVHIIPFTWQHTSLRQLQRGGTVNLETDILGKYVWQYLHRASDGGASLTAEKLAAAGWDVG
jgi:riboflavin synthase